MFPFLIFIRGVQMSSHVIPIHHLLRAVLSLNRGCQSVFPASLAQPTPNSFSAASDSQLYTSCASNVSNQSTSSIPNPQVSVDLPTASMAQLSTDLSPDHHALQSARVPSPTSPSKYGLLCFTVFFTFYHSRTPLYRHLLNMDASLLQIACLIVPGEKPLHSL